MIKVLLDSELMELCNDQNREKGNFVNYDHCNKIWVAIDTTTDELLIENYIDLDDAVRWLSAKRLNQEKNYQIKHGPHVSNNYYTATRAIEVASMLKSLSDLPVEIMDVF